MYCNVVPHFGVGSLALTLHVILLHSFPFALVTVTSGAVRSIFVAPLLVQLFVFHALSLIVTLHVPLFAFIVHAHHAVWIHAPLSVLPANVAVTFHVVQLFNAGLYVHVPHVGAFVSYVYVTVHCTVLHSSSANVTVHVASHSPLLGGVTLIPLLLHVALHAVQLIFHVLLILLAPHAPSFAHILLIKSL